MNRYGFLSFSALERLQPFSQRKVILIVTEQCAGGHRFNKEVDYLLVTH